MGDTIDAIMEISGAVRGNGGARDIEQDSVVDAPVDSRLLVEAGPGTGKTQVAAGRLVSLLKRGVRPGQILVLSFSRSAVRTLTDRMARADARPAVLEELRHVSIRTFDSWAFRILRMAGEPPRALLTRTHDANIRAVTELLRGPRCEEVLRLIGDRRHIVVDEFQDLPGVRGELVVTLLELLAPAGKAGAGFTVLGDRAQAIYGWAARNDSSATPEAYWRRVCQTYAGELKVITLKTNHRATPEIARIGAGLRATLDSSLTGSEKLERVEAALRELPEDAVLDRSWLSASGGTHAILTRTNGEALRVARALFGKEKAGPAQPVQLRTRTTWRPAPAWIASLLDKVQGHSLTHDRFVRIHAHQAAALAADVISAIGLPEEPVAWTRLCHATGAADGATEIDLRVLRERLDWPDAFPDDSLDDVGLVITTVHQSKGMEFEAVSLLEPQAHRQTSEERDDDDDEEHAEDDTEDLQQNETAQEQANVGFVGVTRAARSLRRLPSSRIHPPPHSRKFPNRRQRLLNWRFGWVNLEIGLRGDVDPSSFVSSAVLGGDAEVAAVQAYLAERADQLVGQEVVLVKVSTEPGKAFYNIHIQNEDGRGMMIGRATSQLTGDLNHLLSKKGYRLPWAIRYLRIAAVGTFAGAEDLVAPQPWGTSRLWLGVTLQGTGDFKPERKQ